MLSATSRDAVGTFIAMKNIVKAVVDKYGTGKMRYGLIVFGNTASVKVRFNDYFPSKEEIKNFMETVPRSSGGPALANALDEANKLFGTSGRPNAKKVLVLMIDNKSVSTPKDVKKQAERIHEKKVLVIAVNVGDSADSSDVDNVVPVKDNIFTIDTNEEPKAIADEITSVIDKGDLVVINLLNVSTTLFSLSKIKLRDKDMLVHIKK